MNKNSFSCGFFVFSGTLIDSICELLILSTSDFSGKFLICGICARKILGVRDSFFILLIWLILPKLIF